MTEQIARRFLKALYLLEELVEELVDTLEDLYADASDVFEEDEE